MHFSFAIEFKQRIIIILARTRDNPVNSASNIYDAFNETWGQQLGDDNGDLTDSQGISLGDGTYQVRKPFLDGSPFKNFMDEQGKININYANNLLFATGHGDVQVVIDPLLSGDHSRITGAGILNPTTGYSLWSGFTNNNFAGFF